MNRGQDAPQPEAVAHRQREFRQHLARLRAHDGHPEQTIASLDAILACREALETNVAPQLAMESLMISLHAA